MWEVTPGSGSESPGVTRRSWNSVKPLLLVTIAGSGGTFRRAFWNAFHHRLLWGTKEDVFLPRHPLLIVYHSLLDLLLNGPEAKLSGCTDVNYSRLLLISCVSYSFWNRDRKPQPLWSLKTQSQELSRSLVCCHSPVSLFLLEPEHFGLDNLTEATPHGDLYN